MAENEYGQCDVCGKGGIVQRTYFHYNIECECHSPKHFEMVRHCSTCTPKEPTETRVSIKTEKLKLMTEVPATPVTHPFEKELETLINRHSMENGSDTPDFILAQYMFTCLSAYQNAVNARDKWLGVDRSAENKTIKL